MKEISIIKKLFLLILLVCLFSGSVRVVQKRLWLYRQDKVILRFAVTSGTGVYDETNTTLRNFFEQVYGYAGTRSYKTVDAFIVNGNVTDDGTKEAFDSVEAIVRDSLQDGTKFYTTRAGGDFMVGAEGEDSVEDLYLLDKLEDGTVKIKGYSFVFLTPYYNYYQPKLEWLDTTLERITEYSSKPVFVFQFDAVKDTYYGTESWYAIESDALLHVLEKYPMVVDFSSSSSTASNTARSVFQKKASYVNTGVVSNFRMNISEFGHDTYNEVIHSGNDGVSQCKIVEVYGSGKVEILTMDLNTGELYRTPDEKNTLLFTLYPGNEETYRYTEQNQFSADEPWFREDMNIIFETNEAGETEMVFDNACDEDGILFYELIVSDRVGNTISELCTYADFSQWKLPESERVSLGILEKGKYRVEIIPYDIFGTAGKAKAALFSVE